MRIGFTGHRDKLAPQGSLNSLTKEYPDAVWYHGGAKGFDTQVETFAVEHGIKTKVVPPLYDKIHPIYDHPPSAFVKPWNLIAPLERNKVIVKCANLLIALWDGRESGGTYFTIMYAFKHHKKVGFIRPLGGVEITDTLVGKLMEKAKDWNGDSGIPEPTTARFPCLLLEDRFSYKR